MEQIDIFSGLGIEILLKEPDDFLKIKETLTRIGIASDKEKKLFQSCHILHKRNRYAIMHFKELFILDGKESNISEEDILRRDIVVDLLKSWNLLTIVNPEELSDISDKINIRILSHKEKALWQLISKYTIGTKRG